MTLIVVAHVKWSTFYVTWNLYQFVPMCCKATMAHTGTGLVNVIIPFIQCIRIHKGSQVVCTLMLLILLA